MDTLKWVNRIITVAFFICYSYQFLYIPLYFILRSRRSERHPSVPHRFAFMICARNEETVIKELIHSIHRQTGDQCLVDVYVAADNCCDGTAEMAREAGAVVYERRDETRVGKGYALDFLYHRIRRDHPEGYDGYFIFDADNILKHDYVEKMNRTFSQGYEIITSYRNSKNYGDNWISAGYSLWFLRESRFLNHVRFLAGTSCAVSGTGFLVSQSVLEELGGWPFHRLTEDIEFSVHEIVKGRRIAFCHDAEFYDEQPTSLSQSWRQRLRWSRGGLQVFTAYAPALAKGIFSGSFSCYDMAMAIMPAFILSVTSVVCNVILSLCGAASGDNLFPALISIGRFFVSMYASLYLIGAVTVLTEWKHIESTAIKKLLYTFTFPLFMFTYLPIALEAVFVDPGWKQINHTHRYREIERKTETIRQ